MRKLAGLILTAVAASGVVGCGRAISSDAHPRGAAAAPRSLHGVGYVEPVGEVRRLAFKHGGVVGACVVGIGQRVAAGTVLMTLRAPEERAAVAEAEAAVALARAELEQVCAGISALQIDAARSAHVAAEAEAVRARHEFSRQSKLFDERVASRAEFDLAEANGRRADALVAQRAAELSHLEHFVRDTDRAVARARVRAAEAKLATARERLAETELRAPCDGVVLECLRREGEATAGGAGEPVLIFADPARLCVRAEIDETQAIALRAGQDAIISGAALGGREFAGRVSLVKAIMGKKTVFAQTATERKDLDALQVLIELPPEFSAPIGLEVDVRVLAGSANRAGAEET